MNPSISLLPLAHSPDAATVNHMVCVLPGCPQMHTHMHAHSWVHIIHVAGGSGLAHPDAISSCLTVLPFPRQHVWYVQQVKFLKLPAFLSSRPGGHVRFPTSMIIWLSSLFPPLAWRTLQHTWKPLLNTPHKTEMIGGKACAY